MCIQIKHNKIHIKPTSLSHAKAPRIPHLNMFGPDIGRITSWHFMYNVEEITIIPRRRSLPLWHRHNRPRLPCWRRRWESHRRKILVVRPHCAFSKSNLTLTFTEKTSRPFFLNFQENVFSYSRITFNFSEDYLIALRKRERENTEEKWDFLRKIFGPFSWMSGKEQFSWGKFSVCEDGLSRKAWENEKSLQKDRAMRESKGKCSKAS